MEFEGKVAVVTGAGSGLGAALIRGLAAEGAAVVAADIDAEAADRTAKELSEAGVRAIGVQVDTSDDEQVAAMAAAAQDAFGRIDILVNNAGWRPYPAGHAYDDLPDENSSEYWLRILAVNVVGPMLCSHAVRPAMAAGSGGAIVNLSSMAAFLGAGVYGISKLAVNGLTISLAEDFAADGIRVNAIAPGTMTGRVDAAVLEAEIAKQIIPRRGHPDDLVGPVVFLCSDRSSFITGQTVLVDGGSIRRT
jgi:3-oxoacyl-[acyl-carrier protein] reductase